MAILELQLPYPDFQMYEIIDPEQFDANNRFIESKVNEVLYTLNTMTDSVTSGGGAKKISIEPIAPFISRNVYDFLKEMITRLNSTTDNVSGADFVGSTTIPGVTGTTVQSQLESLKSLIDVEKNNLITLNGRVTANESAINNRYTKAETDAKDTALQMQITTTKNDLTALQGNFNTHNHDQRYMTRTELAPYLQGGDTRVVIEVFTITGMDTVSGTMEYTSNGQSVIVPLGTGGIQVFKLVKGRYARNMNLIKALINDTVTLSVASGGLVEVSDTEVGLANIQPIGTEVTVEYFERIGVTGEHNIIYSPTNPPPTTGATMWYKDLGSNKFEIRPKGTNNYGTVINPITSIDSVTGLQTAIDNKAPLSHANDLSIHVTSAQKASLDLLVNNTSPSTSINTSVLEWALSQTKNAYIGVRAPYYPSDLPLPGEGFLELRISGGIKTIYFTTYVSTASNTTHIRPLVGNSWTVPWTRLLTQTDYNTLFQSVSNGKTAIANAITQKGVPTSATAEFANMANNISSISSTSIVGHGTYTGSFSQSYFVINVTGLPFRPKNIVISASSNGNGSVVKSLRYNFSEYVGFGNVSWFGSDSTTTPRIFVTIPEQHVIPTITANGFTAQVNHPGSSISTSGVNYSYTVSA